MTGSKFPFAKFRYLAWSLWIVVMGFFSYKMVMLSVPYLALEKNVDFLATKHPVYHIDYWRAGFYVHVFSSVFALLAGAFQFIPLIIRAYPKFHRACGWIYISIVLGLSGPGAMAMAFHANGGLPAKASFVLLTSLWLLFSALALYHVVRKNYVQHGNFMVRSYALTLSAITLRLMVYSFAVFNIEATPPEKYITVAWLSWVPNLLVAEWLIQNGMSKRLLKFRTKKNPVS